MNDIINHVVMFTLLGIVIVGAIVGVILIVRDA
jgi:hypothetical protein